MAAKLTNELYKNIKLSLRFRWRNCCCSRQPVFVILLSCLLKCNTSTKAEGLWRIIQLFDYWLFVSFFAQHVLLFFLRVASVIWFELRSQVLCFINVVRECLKYHKTSFASSVMTRRIATYKRIEMDIEGRSRNCYKFRIKPRRDIQKFLFITSTAAELQIPSRILPRGVPADIICANLDNHFYLTRKNLSELIQDNFPLE